MKICTGGGDLLSPPLLVDIDVEVTKITEMEIVDRNHGNYTTLSQFY